MNKAYRLVRRKIDYVNKKETFVYKTVVGQYMTITIKQGPQLELIKEVGVSIPE